MFDNDSLYSTLADQFNKDLPVYDDYMYLRGYSAQETYIAFRKSMNRKEQEHNDEITNAQAEPMPDAGNISIRGEVILNGKRI